MFIYPFCSFLFSAIFKLFFWFLIKYILYLFLKPYYFDTVFLGCVWKWNIAQIYKLRRKKNRKTWSGFGLFFAKNQLGYWIIFLSLLVFFGILIGQLYGIFKHVLVLQRTLKIKSSVANKSNGPENKIIIVFCADLLKISFLKYKL